MTQYISPASRFSRALMGSLTAVLALALNACSTGTDSVGPDAAVCEQMRQYQAPTDSPSLVVVLDHSRSTRDSGGLPKMLESTMEKQAGSYATVSVLLVEGRGGTPRWLLDDLAMNDKKYEFGSLKFTAAVDRAAACVAALAGNAVPTMQGTDLGSAIDVAVDRLALTRGKRTLAVVTDGLSNVGPVNLTGLVGQTPVATAVSNIAAAFQPHLNGIDVTWVGLGVTSGAGVTPESSVRWLRDFYLAVCRAHRAATCTAPVSDQGASGPAGTAPRSKAPSDPQVLADHTYEFTEGSSAVRFAPNSAALSTDADTDLASVASTIKSGSTLTVVGHAASTGNPQGELTLSIERARAVAGRLLTLAGHPSGVVVRATGVGSREPVSATNDRPEDRRVVVSVSGSGG